MPHIEIEDDYSALLVALALAFLNSIVKPILTLLTIPVTVFTFGFFLLVINAFMIGLADQLVSGFRVDSFWWAMLFSIVLSITTGVLNAVLGLDRTESVRED